MPQSIPQLATQRSHRQPTMSGRVVPSRVDPLTARPFTLEQELEPFGSWVGEPIWVPPKNSSSTMAQTMLSSTGPFTSKSKRWTTVVEKHREDFTQVREIELAKASIRLPKGKFFVSVTEQKNFDQITDTIPNCVQTRLDEFLQGPGKKRGVKVYYLKPLCVEVEDELILTSREELDTAIASIQEEVFSEYRQQAIFRRPMDTLIRTVNLSLAIPRGAINYFVQRRQRAIDAYQARLEFKRRKTALCAARTHRKYRTDGCTFDEMLALTNPLKRQDVVAQYAVENDMSEAQKEHLIQMALGTLPWFMTLSIGLSQMASIALALSMTATPPIVVCDPVFVAEMPGSQGEVLKIGHFDEVAGVTHIEI